MFFLKNSANEERVMHDEEFGTCNEDLVVDDEEFCYDSETDTLMCPQERELSFTGEYRFGSGTYRQYRAKRCQNCPFYSRCVPSGKGSRTIQRSVIAKLREAMRGALATPEGQAIYAVRRETVEPVFGCLKQNFGFRRFLLRGVKGAKAEAALVFTAHNVLKWIKWAKNELICHLIALLVPPPRPQQSRPAPNRACMRSKEQIGHALRS